MTTHKVRWTEQEHAFVAAHYQDMSHEDMGTALGRSRGAVRNYCYYHGLITEPAFWTKNEIALLRDCYARPNPNLNDLAAMVFPGRCKANICRKAGELGLTNSHRPKDAEQVSMMGTRVREWHKTHEHPRGYLGHKHGTETRRLLAQKSKAAWQDPNCKSNSVEARQRRSDIMHERHVSGEPRQGYSRGRMGKRDDLGGLFVRSAWEANYARYLTWLMSIGEIVGWEYEPDVFDFTEIKRGTRSYIPDFKVYTNGDKVEYHEVKGWMDAKSVTKLKRMRRYYPDVVVKVIDAVAYKALARDVKNLIPNWETDIRHHHLDNLVEDWACLQVSEL